VRVHACVRAIEFFILNSLNDILFYLSISINYRLKKNKIIDFKRILNDLKRPFSDFYKRVERWSGINPNELRDDLIAKNLVRVVKRVVKKYRTSFLMVTKKGAKYV